MPKGGKRKGAGRPPRTDGARACQFVLSEAARRLLATVQRELGVTASAAVERAIIHGLLATLGKAMRRKIVDEINKA